LTAEIPEFPEDKINIIEGKYEVFEVGDEWVFSEERKAIKEYARKQGAERITYKASFNSKKGAENVAKEV